MNVCLMEMDERTRQSVALVLSHRGDDSIVLGDLESADVAVLDLDHAHALAAFRDAQALRPALRAIGLGAQPEGVDADILVLRKPVSAGRLLEAIQAQGGIESPVARVLAAGAAAALAARTESGRRRPDSTLPPPREQASFDPDSYLLGVLMNAAAEAEKRDAVAVVRFYGDRLVLADPQRGLIRTNLSPSQTRGFAMSAIEGAADAPATGRLSRPQVEFLARAEAESRYADATYAVPYEILMWQLGALTSRGRLAASCRADERVYLRRWPNLTRLAHSATEMRILAYWVRQAASPQEIAAALDVPERDVFTVYTAACAAGLAGKARRELDTVWEAPAVAAPRERGLLSSILGRLLQRKPACNEEPQAAAA